MIEQEILTTSKIAADGSFELLQEVPGEFSLRVHGPGSESGRLEIQERLQLESGENPWKLELGFGSIDGAGADASAGSEAVLEYRMKSLPGRESLKVSQRIVPNSAGEFALSLVPSGPGLVWRYEPKSEEREWGGWVELMEFTVDQGETLSLDLP